jgi:serine/threonine protein kinase
VSIPTQDFNLLYFFGGFVKPETLPLPFEVGQEFAGTKLGKLIYNGKNGTLYQCVLKSLNKKAAIKVLSIRSVSEERRKRFLRELRTTVSLDHPNIIKVYLAGKEAYFYYIIMEYIEGVNLEEMISLSQELPLQKACYILNYASKALEEAHRQGIIHRDVKPENILISKEGVVKLLDFGVARFAESDGTEQLTQTGQIIGSPLYMSPEQCKGEPTDFRSDIYSLGITFYFATAGIVPFNAEDPVTIMLKHIREEATPPRLLREEISPKMNDVIMKMLQKDPQKRYQTIEEFREDLKTLAVKKSS